MRAAIVFSLLGCIALGSVTASAASNGNADEARAMLEKASVALKADKATALNKFSKGDDGFRDRDLYPFCGGPDGRFSAHPKLVGQSMRDLHDKAGKAFGEEIYTIAQEGTVRQVSYMWPRIGSPTAVEKVTFVIKVDDQICAVGYYKQ